MIDHRLYALASADYLERFTSACDALALRGLPSEGVPSAALRRNGSVAVMPLAGFVTKRPSVIERFAGALALDDVMDMATEAAADDGIERVVMDIDSPGGRVVGLPEASAALRELAGQKELVAYTDNVMASAAYELASAADYVVAAPSAIVGSIGTILSLPDTSGAMERAGVSMHVYKSGDLKDMGSPYRAPTDEEAARFQSRVDAEGARFRASVAASRPGVQEGAMRGQVFTGADAVGAGLVDELMPRIEGLL